MNRIWITLCALSAAFTCAFGQSASPDPVRNAYSLSLSRDIPLSVLSVSTFALGQWRVSHMTGYQGGYDQNKLLPWDKPFAGTFSGKANLASNVLCGAAVFPVALAGYDWNRGKLGANDVGTQLAMLTQVLALQSGINLAVRSIALWPRPLVFHSGVDSSLMTKDVAGSFYSGHSSAAFAIAVFSGVWFDRTHPGSPYSHMVWAGALATASSIAILRVAAGKHYPSDVITGAIVGSFVGWVVPKLHEQAANSGAPSNLVLAPIPSGALLQFTF